MTDLTYPAHFYSQGNTLGLHREASNTFDFGKFVVFSGMVMIMTFKKARRKSFTIISESEIGTEEEENYCSSSLLSVTVNKIHVASGNT